MRLTRQHAGARAGAKNAYLRTRLSSAAVTAPVTNEVTIEVAAQRPQYSLVPGSKPSSVPGPAPLPAVPESFTRTEKEVLLVRTGNQKTRRRVGCSKARDPGVTGGDSRTWPDLSCCAAGARRSATATAGVPTASGCGCTWRRRASTTTACS
jgi:hypothetical protein